MRSPIYAPANDRLRLLTFDKGNISLFNSKSGELMEIPLLLAKALRLINGNKATEEIFTILKLTKSEQKQLAIQLKKMAKCAFLLCDTQVEKQSLNRMINIDETTCIYPPLKAMIFHITKKCNIRCIHCYADADMELNAEKSELSFAEVTSVLECFSDMGGLSVDITGGEPLTRPDIFEIIERATRLRIHVRLLSNGILLQNKSLATKIGKQADEIILSLDGLKHTHNWIRNGDYYDVVIGVVRYLVSQGYRVGITTLLTHKSLYELPQIAELLVNIGVEKWNLNLPRSVGRAGIEGRLSNDTLREYYCDTEGTLALLRKAYHIAASGNILVMGELSMFPQKIRETINRDDDPFYKVYEKNRACCNSTLCVFANGDVVPCLFYPDLVYGNVRNTSLDKLCGGNARQSLMEMFANRPANAICPAISADLVPEN